MSQLRDTKQVIVVRTHYPNSSGGTKTVSKGKMLAQACHASMSFLTKNMKFGPSVYHAGGDYKYSPTDAQKHWLDNSYAKVCLKVETEEELDDIYHKAIDAGLQVHMIVDEGRTSFGNVPTKTCIAIGPDWCEKFDGVTDNLKMF